MVPYTYNKPQIDLLYKLIAESNPGAAYPLIPENAKIGKPEAIVVVPGTITNTRIPISGQGPYVALARVNYRRINLTELFKNITISFNTWTGSNYIGGVTLREYLNKTYGLALTGVEIPDGAMWVGGSNIFNVGGASLCYTGAISWTWVNGKRTLDSVITNPDVDGRMFPGGNVFDGSRKPQGEYIAYDLDFSSQKDFLSGFVASASSWGGVGAGQVPLFDFMKANLSPLFDKAKQHTEVGGFIGAPYIHVALPNATIPEANSLSSKFTHVVAISSLPTSWWQGKIFLHYKR